MLVELIDFGGKAPERARYNDAGADVFAKETRKISPGHTEKIPLGIGIKTPDGYMTELRPRSGLASKGIFCIPGTIDAGYEGELSATIANVSGAPYTVKEGDKIAQLGTLPIALTEFTYHLPENKRGSDGFGSTGR